MQYSHLGGKGFPIIQVMLEADDSVVEEFNLPFCTAEGQGNSADLEGNMIELYNYTRLQELAGARKKWVLNYSLMTGIELKKIFKIIDYLFHGYRGLGAKYLNLIPRNDDAAYKYKVNFTNKTIVFNLINDNEYPEGHEGIILEFETMELTDLNNMTDPNEAVYQPTGEGIDNII